MTKMRWGQLEVSIDDLLDKAIQLIEESGNKVERKQKWVVDIENPTKYEDTWRFRKLKASHSSQKEAKK